jgi:hypothetical protein
MTEYIEEFVMAMSMKLIVIFLQNQYTIGISAVNGTKEKRSREIRENNLQKIKSI